MTGQGKVDRRRLISDFQRLAPEEISAFSVSAGDEADTSEMSQAERQLVSALAKTLSLTESSIRRNTSFFALGLDSLSAIRFSRNVRDSTGHQVDVSAILKRPTIARLAAFTEDKLEATSPRDVTISSVGNFLEVDIAKTIRFDFDAQKLAIKAILPCTPLQEAMLSASSGPQSPAYNNRMLFSLQTEPNVLKQAWKCMLDRHDILRTTFCSTDDTQHPFVQVVLERFDLPWNQKHLNLDREDLINETSNPLPPAFDGYVPPYSMSCYISASQKSLVVDMHHALYDANAMSILLSEIEQICRGVKLPSPPPFSDFLAYMVSCDASMANAWFQEHLKGFRPKPFRRQLKTDGLYATVERQLPLSQQEVNGFLQQYALSLLALSQGAWARTLSILQTSKDICFGNLVSGRSVPVNDVERLVAPTLNTLPIRIDSSKSRNNLDLVKQLQKINVDMLPYQLTPLRRVQQKFAAGQHLFDSLILLQQPSTPLDPSIWSLQGETGEMNVSSRVIHDFESS